MKTVMNRAVFFDRDGIINKKAPEHDYIKSWNEFKLIHDIIDVMKHVQSKGYKIIIVTNQRGIARGLMTTEDLLEIHENLKRELFKYKIFITDILFCPHDINENCDCRKPKPGMLLKAKKLYDINFEKSYFIGDCETDIISANSVNVKSILYIKNSCTKTKQVKPSYIVTSLKEIIKII